MVQNIEMSGAIICDQGTFPGPGQFRYGWRSNRALRGVHPNLVALARYALRITQEDISVIEGLRTQKRQLVLFQEKRTRTFKSRHLTGHAIDVKRYGGWRTTSKKTSEGRDWDGLFEILPAFKMAANDLEVAITWGGCWDKRFNDLGDLKHERDAYAQRVVTLSGGHKRPFLDGFHLELCKEAYPDNEDIAPTPIAQAFLRSLV